LHCAFAGYEVGTKVTFWGVRLLGVTSLCSAVDAATNIMNGDPNGLGTEFVVLSVQHPAEIVSYQSICAAPALLGRTRRRSRRALALRHCEAS
jgi:hypothetical protein